MIVFLNKKLNFISRRSEMIKSKFTCMLFLIFLIGIAFSCFAGTPSPNIYHISMGEFSDQYTANAKITSLKQAGIISIKLVQNNDNWNIQFGEFPYYMDAYVSLEELKSHGYKDIYIGKKKNDFGKTNFEKIEEISEKVFKIKETSGVLESCSIDTDEPDVIAISEKIYTIPTEQLQDEVLQKIELREDSDPVKGWLTMKLAYIKCRQKDRGTARQLFQKIAEGKVAAPPEIRHNAMMRVAKMIHGEKDRTKAFKAFKELYELSPGDEQKSESLKHLGALMMEMARSSKGTLEETRIFMENSLDEIPIDMVEARATIEQMHMESWYYEDNYEKTIEEGHEILQNSDIYPMKIIATCHLFMGLAYGNSDNYDEAIKSLNAILDMPLGPEDRWKAIPDFKKHSLIWMINLSKRYELDQAAKKWEETMESMYPVK
jgi:tetratricopeptide (TPR) repeat protein